MQDDLRVGRRGEDGALLLQFVAQVAAVYEVPVVAEGHIPVLGGGQNGTGVAGQRTSRGGIAHVADGAVPGEIREVPPTEDFGDEAHALGQMHGRSVEGRHAGGLLPAVLERIEPVHGQLGRLGMPVDAEDAAHGFEVALRRSGSW